ncbi:uncharacterized protein LOC142768297 [Rhipicephalus microplus]|uniref:uncharacterized protein LOC142768297 n=1 Tax=Rhipicephalus microplus TaxID=6941 RepID=UPI003F6AD9E2
MAVVDSSSKFVLVDIGAEGRQSDGRVFKNTKFGKALTEGQLDIPLLGQLPGTTKVAPYAFVGDEAFQLRRDFMRPFPARLLEDERRVFNYRLSRARRCAENAFGITHSKWRILLRTIQLLPKNVDYVVKAACVLRNFLAVLNEESDQILDQEDRFGNVVPGRWRQDIQQTSGQGHVDPCYFPLQGSQSRNFSADAADARTLFSAYFCSSAGELPWQWHQPGVSKQGALKRLEEQGLHPCARDMLARLDPWLSSDVAANPSDDAVPSGDGADSLDCVASRDDIPSSSCDGQHSTDTAGAG